jgi:hypothetical protein
VPRTRAASARSRRERASVIRTTISGGPCKPGSVPT